MKVLLCLSNLVTLSSLPSFSPVFFLISVACASVGGDLWQLRFPSHSTSHLAAWEAWECWFLGNTGWFPSLGRSLCAGFSSLQSLLCLLLAVLPLQLCRTPAELPERPCLGEGGGKGQNDACRAGSPGHRSACGGTSQGHGKETQQNRAAALVSWRPLVLLLQEIYSLLRCSCCLLLVG